MDAASTDRGAGLIATSDDGFASVDALVEKSFAVMGVLTRVAAENGLSLTQLRVLGILRDRRLRMAELADFLGLDRSSLSGLIDRAEQRGLVQRTRNPDDKRVIEVGMTPIGLEQARAAQEQIRRALTP